MDIFIPVLKLAFELNGIYHYEPIHGPTKLSQIQNNDQRKFQACLERGIELCIIDSSSLSYFKESNALPYLKIIQKIIDQKIKAEGIELSVMPLVVYDYDVSKCTNNLNKVKSCKHCNNEFVYSQTPKQVFCTKKCNTEYRQKNSRIYSQMLRQKEEIKTGIEKGLSWKTICNNIGFQKCSGGYYYAIKKIIDEINLDLQNKKTQASLKT